MKYQVTKPLVQFDDLIPKIAENNSKHFIMGEHVIAETKWYLGVVEGMINDNPVI